MNKLWEAPHPGVERPTGNLLLDALGLEAFSLIEPYLFRADLTPDQVVAEAGKRARRVLFPVSGIISRMISDSDGHSTHTALSGCESLIGASGLLDARAIFQSTALVQRPGQALCLPLGVAMQAFRSNREFHDVVLGYSLVLMRQIAQNIYCNRFHSVEMRFCRWLLLSMDLAGGADIFVSQEQVSAILGMRRETVAIVMSRLQHAGLLHIQRRHIHVTNRDGLRDRACVCYGHLQPDAGRAGRRLPAEGRQRD